MNAAAGSNTETKTKQSGLTAKNESTDDSVIDQVRVATENRTSPPAADDVILPERESETGPAIRAVMDDLLRQNRSTR